MHRLISNIQIKVNENIFLKDPSSSNLGQRIISGGLDLTLEIGFEDLTFKKLAKKIDSTEASIYRYFENKHKLLLYLVNWYWVWTEYRLVFSLANITSPKERLIKAVHILTSPVSDEWKLPHMDTVKLNKIVLSESSKVYLTREVDNENKGGVFSAYKRVVGRVSDIITEINPAYKYPHMLISTAIEGAHHQRFFSEHLPRLTDNVDGEDAVVEFYKDMILKAIV